MEFLSLTPTIVRKEAAALSSKSISLEFGKFSSTQGRLLPNQGILSGAKEA
jgi:hypothetical protein